MTFVLKLLPHSNLTSVETLPIMAVDWFRGGRPGGGGGKEREMYTIISNLSNKITSERGLCLLD